MLRAPVAAFAILPFIFGSPIWPWIVKSQLYSIPMELVETRYKEDIVQPWLDEIKKEAQKALDGTISTSSGVARAAVNLALDREDERYRRGLETTAPLTPPELVQQLVALHGSLVAAEAALWRNQDYLKEFVTRE